MAILERTPPRKREDAHSPQMPSPSQSASTSAVPLSSTKRFETQRDEFPSLDAMALSHRDGSVFASSSSMTSSAKARSAVISTQKNASSLGSGLVTSVAPPAMAPTAARFHAPLSSIHDDHQGTDTETAEIPQGVSLSPADRIVRRLSTVNAPPKLALTNRAAQENSPSASKSSRSPLRGPSTVTKRSTQQLLKAKRQASPERPIRPPRPTDSNSSSADDAFQRQLEAALLADNPFLKERAAIVDEEDRAPASVPSLLPRLPAAVVNDRKETQPRQPRATVEQEEENFMAPAPQTHQRSKQVEVQSQLTDVQERSRKHQESDAETFHGRLDPDRSKARGGSVDAPMQRSNEAAEGSRPDTILGPMTAPDPSNPLNQPTPQETSQQPSSSAQQPQVEQEEQGQEQEQGEEEVEQEENQVMPAVTFISHEQMQLSKQLSRSPAIKHPLSRRSGAASLPTYSQEQVDTLEKHIEKLEKRHRQHSKECHQLRTSLGEAKADAEFMCAKWKASKATADETRHSVEKLEARLRNAEVVRDKATLEASQRVWERFSGPDGPESNRQRRIELVEARNEATYHQSRAKEQSLARQELELTLHSQRRKHELALEAQARDHEAAIGRLAREHETAERQLRSALGTQRGTSAFEEKERKSLASRLERVETERANLAVESQGYSRLLEEERQRCAKLREELAGIRGRATIQQELRKELALVQNELMQVKRAPRDATTTTKAIVPDRSAAGKRKAATAPSTRHAAYAVSYKESSVDSEEHEQEQAADDENLDDFDVPQPTSSRARLDTAKTMSGASKVGKAPKAKTAATAMSRNKKRPEEAPAKEADEDGEEDDFDGPAMVKKVQPQNQKPVREGQRETKVQLSSAPRRAKEKETTPLMEEEEVEALALSIVSEDDDVDENDDDGDEYTLKKSGRANNKRRHLGNKPQAVQAGAAVSTKPALSSASNDKSRIKEDEKRRKAMEKHVEATPMLSNAKRVRQEEHEAVAEEALSPSLVKRHKPASAKSVDKENEAPQSTMDKPLVDAIKEPEPAQEKAPPPQPKKKKMLLNRNKQPASANFLDMRGDSDGNLEPVFNLPLAMSPIKGGTQQQQQPQGALGGRPVAGSATFGAAASSLFRR